MLAKSLLHCHFKKITCKKVHIYHFFVSWELVNVAIEKCGLWERSVDYKGPILNVSQS